MCDMSHVTYHMSYITCNILHTFFVFTKWWSLLVEALLSTWSTFLFLFLKHKFFDKDITWKRQRNPCRLGQTLLLVLVFPLCYGAEWTEGDFGRLWWCGDRGGRGEGLWKTASWRIHQDQEPQEGGWSLLLCDWRTQCSLGCRTNSVIIY